ncbi:C4-dicarboxylate ABC transporter [Dietzia sp. DQ11-71]|nr:C4-dicarboxylate ABC transporter [Dietzia sp. DQ11-71]MBB1017517.1 C4-dicarboxylate ABC transporter [Dietzia sp. DQ11-71]
MSLSPPDFRATTRCGHSVLVTTSRGPRSAPAAPSVPGPGPAWFGAVMGTGGLATLLQIHAVRVPGFAPAAVVMVILGWVLLLGLGAGFARSVARAPDMWTSSVRDAAMLPLWGMVSMGLLAVGSASFVVVDARAPALSTIAFGVDAALWAAGTVLGLATALRFTVWLVTARPDHPLPTWALPVVPPMVSAGAGGLMSRHVDSEAVRSVLVGACSVCFVLALVLGGAVIARTYHHAWFRTPVPVELATTTWIPLGIVGQSAAAAQVLFGATLGGVARVYAASVLVAGAGLGAYAVFSTIRGFLARMPFNPGWWAMAYPLSTCALGSFYLDWDAASVFTVMVLIVIWSLCAVASVRAIARARAA